MVEIGASPSIRRLNVFQHEVKEFTTVDVNFKGSVCLSTRVNIQQSNPVAMCSILVFRPGAFKCYL